MFFVELQSVFDTVERDEKQMAHEPFWKALTQSLNANLVEIWIAFNWSLAMRLLKANRKALNFRAIKNLISSAFVPPGIITES